jgi:hypothetical protein
LGKVTESVSSLAERIDADLRTLADRCVATVRKARRRWSALLRNEAAEVVFGAAAELVDRFDHRWIAYELLLFHQPAFALVDASNVERFAGELRSWGDAWACRWLPQRQAQRCLDRVSPCRVARVGCRDTHRVCARGTPGMPGRETICIRRLADMVVADEEADAAARRRYT